MNKPCPALAACPCDAALRCARVTGDIIVALVVVAALGFDFTNGFHDTANAMATTIATGALKPKVAVTIAAILNFVGAFISLKVAATVAGGIVDAGAITPTVVFGGLVGRDRLEPRRRGGSACRRRPRTR